MIIAKQLMSVLTITALLTVISTKEGVTML